MLFSIEKNKKEPKVAGFAKIGFNEDGTKGIILTCEANNPHLQDQLLEFVDQNIESLIPIKEIKSKVEDLSNKMFLITFFYVPYSSFNGEQTEWDINISLSDIILLDDNFRETWQLQLSFEYHHSKKQIINFEQVDAYGIELYEELYEENFEFVD